MKKLLFLLLLPLTFVACDSSADKETSDTPETEETNAYEGMIEVSLDTFDIPMDVMVPQYEGINNMPLPHRLESMDDGRWSITIVSDDKVKYALIIEDIKGYYEQAKEEGSELSFVIEDHKAELAGYDFMHVDYLVDEPMLVMYETTYDDENLAHEFQVMGVVEGEDTAYKVYSDRLVPKINKTKAEKMLLSIRSMMEKEEAGA